MIKFRVQYTINMCLPTRAGYLVKKSRVGSSDNWGRISLQVLEFEYYKSW